MIVGNVGDTALTASDFATQYPGFVERGLSFSDLAKEGIVGGTSPTFLQGAENLIRSGVASAAEYAEPGLDAGRRILTGEGSFKDIVPAAQTLGPSVIGAATESADSFSRQSAPQIRFSQIKEEIAFAFKHLKSHQLQNSYEHRNLVWIPTIFCRCD